MKKILFLLAALPAFFASRAQCPDLSSSRKPMASSFHSSVLITYDSVVRYWGDAADITGTGNVVSPLTLAKTNYGGAAAVALSVAAGSTGATNHQLFVHSTVGIYGWGVSNNTIVNASAGQVGITNIALPAGVTIGQVSYIEAAGGGLCLVTTSGNVWVKKGATGTFLIYGDNSSAFNTAWHEVLTAAATPLANVTKVSMSGKSMMALTSTGAVYVWGTGTFLGNGSGATDRGFATLMTNPSGVTPMDVNVNSGTTTGTATVQFILGTNNKIYGVGANDSGALGQGGYSATPTASWVTVKGPGGIGTLDNVVEIGSNNPYPLSADVGGFNIGALTSSGNIYLWGSNSYFMLGNDTLAAPSPAGDSFSYTVPRIPPNFSYNHASIGFFEMGGHTTAAFLAGTSKFCYVGHKVRGSMGDGDASVSLRESFDCINTPPEYVCPPSPSVACPLPSASDIVASSLHATLVINGQPAVAFWGEAASSAEPGINLTAAKTLFEYNGTPKGVAASGVSAGSSAQSTQMWVHTTQGIWGWGYSANTILANRPGVTPMVQLTLPSGVAATDISFIRSSRGGIALVTNSGNVWVMAGAASSCSFRVYGDGSSALDAAGSTAWHQVQTAAATPLTNIVELSFGGTAAIAITSSGTAYVWGDLTFLGDGTGATSRTRAALMTLPAGVTARTAEIIQSGITESAEFILGTTNRIYSLGRNANGVLGIGSGTFTAISTSWNTLSLVGVRKLSSNNPYANSYYSIGALNLTGNVYLWGSNSNGMLGQPIATTELTSPTLATTVATNDASNLEIGGAETIIFAKSTTRFYFAGQSVGGSRADGSADGNTTPFALAGDVANCANVSFNISGHLYNDVNGMTDTLVNGTAVSTLRTTQMYANLLDQAGYIIATTPISGGAYSFTGFPFANYYVQVSPTADTLFNLAPSNPLPSNWVYTGEQIGTVANSGVDTGAANGRIIVSLNATKTDVNFGVEQLPTPVAATLAQRINPGGTTSSVITTGFTGVDTGGTISKIHITAFPTNVTSITIDATTYTAGTWPTSTGVTFATGTVVSIDPIDGAVTSVIPYKVFDNANLESSSSANLNVPFIIIPPVANNIIAPTLNSSDAAKMIPQLKASNPSGTGIKSYTVATIPSTTDGILSYCAAAPTVCALGSLTPVTAGLVLTPAQSASLYFDPAQTFTGNSSFTYFATDSNNLVSNTANYRIPVINNPPKTQNIRTAQIIDTQHAAGIPDLIGADVDGTVVSYTVFNIPAASQGVLTYCSNGTNPCTGTINTISTTTTLTPLQMTWMKFDPALGATGDYIFKYTALDNNNNVSDTSIYAIPVVSLAAMMTHFPPVATNITAQNINNSLGATPIPNLLGTDPDGTINHFTIGASVPNTTTQGTLYYCVTPGAGCTLSPVGPGATLTPAQGATLQFDPVAGFIGTANFTYTAIDNDGTPLTSDVATYKIPVVNNPPVANPSSVTPILNTIGTATLLPPLSGYDADGSVVTYNITSVPATGGTLQYCVTPGAGCTLSTISGPLTGLTPAQVATFKFTPSTTFTGDYIFNFTTVDNNALVSQPATFTIPVIATSAVTTGQPPLAYSYNNAPISSASTAALTIALTGTDPDGSVVSYTITSIPIATHGALTYCVTPGAGCTLSPVAVGTVMTPAQAASIVFTPNANFTGTATFTYTDKDNDGNTSNTATVTVPVVNNPPVANNINNPGINRTASPTTLNPLASTDQDGTIASYKILTVPNADQGVLRLCTTAPSTGCVPVTPGQVLTPAQITNLAFTPDSSDHSPVVSFLYSTTDNSGNLSNIAAVNVPIINAFQLPVELLSFTATKKERDALIAWTTGVEETGTVYEVNHSTDGKTWTTIGSQNARVQAGASHNYSMLHTPLMSGMQYYRLRIVDANNGFVFSPVRSLNFDGAQDYTITVQPNPVTDKLFLNTSDNSIMQQVSVYSNEGKKLQVIESLSSGSSLDMNAYRPGLYLIRIMDKNGNIQTIKITKK